ncbi:conserved hypothetical protein [Xanthomonas citri pv. bilvae]|nr:conserved hypothetical protein [Xanthomonas citri pv. bilvae]
MVSCSATDRSRAAGHFFTRRQRADPRPHPPFGHLPPASGGREPKEGQLQCNRQIVSSPDPQTPHK